MKRNGFNNNEFFNMDEMVMDVSQRFGASNDVSLCDAKDEIIYPEAGTLVNGTWSLIVNTNGFKQGLRIEKCLNPDEPSLYAENFPLIYRAVCRQKYVYRLMIATDETRISKEWFKFPACCSCVLEQN